MVTWAKLMIPSAGMGQVTGEAQSSPQSVDHRHADSALKRFASSKATKASLANTLQSMTDSFMQLDSVVKNI